MVQETFAGAQENVVNAWGYNLCERAIALHAEFLVGAVVTHHIDKCLGQFVAVFLVHPALHCLHHLVLLERVYMVPAACVAAVRAEVAPVVDTLEGHAEIIAS